MDIVLEFVDTYIADFVYAYLFPIKSGVNEQAAGNATLQTIPSWEWQPASKLFHIEPSEAAYMSSLARDNICRQLITLFFVTWFIGIFLYHTIAPLAYCLFFDKRKLDHPKFVKNQIWLEIQMANKALPVMALLTVPFFLLNIRGYTKLYDAHTDCPYGWWWYYVLEFPVFLIFTDFGVYWTHRFFHLPMIYKHTHKLHHRWVISTPFSSYAFHPLDGFAQTIPHHFFPIIFPVHKMVHILMWLFTNVISVHDGEFLNDNSIVLSTACHELHHKNAKDNYGQHFTIFDRLFGTYRQPDASVNQKEQKKSK